MVRQIATLLIIQAQNYNLDVLRELQKLMNKCLVEVETFNETLAKIQVDGRRDKVVKRYKLFIEKDASSFNLQLTLLQRLVYILSAYTHRSVKKSLRHSLVVGFANLTDRHSDAEHARSLRHLHQSFAEKLAIDNGRGAQQLS